MMDTSLDAQIYLADQRGCSQTDFFRSYHTFNFGPYADESRQPFGALQLLNESTLRADASLTMHVEQPTHVLLLPVTGGLEYRYSSANDSSVIGFLEPGQAGTLSLTAGATYTVSNPYENETIQFLEIWLADATYLSAGFQALDFDLTRTNTLLPLFGLVDSPERSQGFIGRYGGREEGEFSVPSTTNASNRNVFAFVLKGVFEVANRLLHEQDGLALQCRSNEVVEFEALSNEAILILLTV